MRWDARLRDRIGSDRKAAGRLFPEWRKKARKEVALADTSETALANKIGSLRRQGDSTGWWAARPVLCQLFADLLEVEVQDIFDHSSTTNSVAFPEFPALKALGTDDLPFRTSRRGSVFDIVVGALRSEERARAWIRVPAGGGKTLALKLLALRFPDEVATCSVVHLSEAPAHARENGGKHLVVEVDEAERSRDLDALRALHFHEHGVVVLAPFGNGDAATRGPWSRVEGAPGPGWIERMLDWIQNRLGADPRDTKFDRDDVLAWFVEHPTVASSVRTPGELLALCADFDLYGVDGSIGDRAERWLDGFMNRGLPEDAPMTWRSQGAADCFRAAVVAHIREQAVALNHRSFAQWTDLVPPRSRPEAQGDIPGAAMAISYFRGGGLLRGTASGVSAYPGWAATGIADRWLHQLFKEKGCASWGALAGDGSRQPLVDGALDRLSLSSLRALGRRVTQHGAAAAEDSFAHVAAMEATTAAVARRLASGDAKESDAEVGRTLLQKQIEFLVSGPGIGEHRVPLTRRDRDEWFLTGWAISLTTPEEVGVPDDLRWLLPGWCTDLRVGDVQTLQFPWSTVDPWGASDAVRALATLVPRVVERLVPQDLPAELPRLLVPSFLLSSAWRVEPRHLTALAGSWEETWLAAQADGMDAKQSQSLARRLWELLGGIDGDDISLPVAARLERLRAQHEPLLSVVVEHLPTEVFGETAKVAGSHRRYGAGNSYAPSDPSVLRLLRAEARTAVVRGWLASDRPQPLRFDEARELAAVLDGEDLELILDVVRIADRDVAAEFASRLWATVPERALEEARHAFAEDLVSAEGWFHLAPRQQIGELVAVVEESAAPPSWVGHWALRRLLDAGPHAEALFRMSRRRL